MVQVELNNMHINEKVKQSHYRPEVPRGFQVKVPRLRDIGP